MNEKKNVEKKEASEKTYEAEYHLTYIARRFYTVKANNEEEAQEKAELMMQEDTTELTSDDFYDSDLEGIREVQ